MVFDLLLKFSYLAPPLCLYCHYTFKDHFHFFLVVQLCNSEKALAQGWDESYQ